MGTASTDEVGDMRAAWQAFLPVAGKSARPLEPAMQLRCRRGARDRTQRGAAPDRLPPLSFLRHWTVDLVPEAGPRAKRSANDVPSAAAAGVHRAPIPVRFAGPLATTLLPFPIPRSEPGDSSADSGYGFERADLRHAEDRPHAAEFALRVLREACRAMVSHRNDAAEWIGVGEAELLDDVTECAELVQFHFVERDFERLAPLDRR